MATRVTIVGAGLAGPLLACFLAREGFNVSLYERRPDPRIGGYIGGRSINLALSARGIDALQRVGLAGQVLDRVIPMRGRMLHEPDRSLKFQRYSRNPQDAINSVSRGELNITLLNAVEKCSNARIYFNHRCIAVDLDRPAVTFEDPTSGATTTVESDLVIAADGAYSTVRQQMQKNDRFDYAQSYLEYGYKELTIPPVAGHFAMDANALHIWPRHRAMMIALPNQDKSFTCTLFWPYEGEQSFANLQTDEQIVAHFTENYPDAVPLMPTLIDDYKRNPIGPLLTVRCWPWTYRGRVALLGDAAHAIVPFYGQGMNAAFEDCVTISDCLREFAPDAQHAFEAYQNRRKPNAEAIADMALHNFVEMRDHVASPIFLMKKKMQHALHGMFPQAFIPLYNMVSFTTIPYAQARAKARWQTHVLRGVAIALITVIALLVIGVVVTARTS